MTVGIGKISQKIGEARRRWLLRPRGEKDRSCTNENMKDQSGWTPKDSKTKTEVE